MSCPYESQIARMYCEKPEGHKGKHRFTYYLGEEQFEVVSWTDNRCLAKSLVGRCTLEDSHTGKHQANRAGLIGLWE